MRLGNKKLLSLACSLSLALSVVSFAQSALATTTPIVESQVSLEQEVARKISEIERDYAIKVEYSGIKSVSKLHFKQSVALNDVNMMLDSILEVLGCYPKNLGNALHIGKINLCGELYSGDIPIDGMSYATFFQDRLRSTDIFLCVPSYNGAQATLHHELLHAIEYTYPVDEKAWNKLMSEDNMYLQDFNYESETYAYASGELVDQPGFVSLYAYSEPMEDRAEIYANIMNYNQDELSRARHSNDALLASKAEFMVNYLSEVFDNIPNSSEYIKTLQACYDDLFGRRFFSARGLYIADEPMEVYTGPNSNYSIVEIGAGEVFYQLSSLQNPKDMLLSLDGDGNVLYVPEEKVSRVNSVQPQPLIEKLLRYDVQVAYDGEAPGIRYECILNGTKVSTKNAMLLYGKLTTILEDMGKFGNRCNIKKIVAVDNLRVDKDPVSTYVGDDTLFIDIHYATKESITTALKPSDELKESA